MEVTDAPSPFSPTLPTFQTAWDSTSLGWLKECPRKYQFSMLLGWEPRWKSVHLTFGAYYASALERYAHARASGATHSEAQIAMLRWVFEATGTRDVDGVFTPWNSGDPLKNRITLIRSLVWNTEDRLHSPFATYILANGRPATELSFNFEAFTVAGHDVSLSGHLDEVVYEVADPKSLWIRDDKTSKNALTKQYFNRYTPDNQMSLYSIAGKIILASPVKGVLVKAAQILVGGTRYATQPIPRPPAVLAEWMHDTERLINIAHQFAEANHWPANDKACGNYGGCPFREVCAVGPSHRPAWLKEGFVKRQWNPLHARGDI